MSDHDSSPAPTALWIDDRRSNDDRRPIDAERRPGPSRFVDVVTSARPRLSWVVPLVRDDQAQTAYEVRITPDPLDPRSAADEALAWTSGPVESAESTWIRPAVDIAPYTRYRWTVRTRDEYGAWSPWAGPAALEAGPLHADDWTASWVTAPSPRTLVGTVDLPVAPVRARLHVTAQGVYRASVGGGVVNPGTAEPSRTDPVRALSRTYDVTDLLTAGTTTVEIDLGSGHWAKSGLDPRLLAEVVAILPDGSVRRCGTCAAWLSRPSRVVVDEAFYVERHDTRPSASVEAVPVTVLGPAADPPDDVDRLPTRIEPDPAPPIRTVFERAAVEIARPGAGRRVYDVGMNIAGRSRLTLLGALPAGTELVLVHGELLAADGSVDTTNLKMPYDGARERQSVEFVTGGASGEVIEPWFAFHGFRYVDVRGLPDDADATMSGLVLHSDLPPIADFDSDDATLRRLVEAAKRTQLNNLHGIPEDCPTREQAGWTGDAAATTDLALAQLDVSGFYRKWLGDLATSQRPDGAIPAIAPSLTPEATPPDPVWGAALQRVLVGHWLHYGDVTLVAEYLPALRRWVDYQLGLVRDGAVRDATISYGHDWLGLAQTPPELLHTGAALDALDTLAELETTVGADAEASRRRAQAADLRATARDAFHDPDRGSWANGSQGAHATAFVAGLADREESTVAAVERDIRARGTRVSTGFAATATLVRALAATGQAQVISDVVHQPEQPGVGAMLADGPGTLWESWWIDPQNTGTGSLDHVGLGGPFAAWVWTGLVGLRPTAPGFRRFDVVPQPVDGVSRAASVTETVRGTVRVAWTRDGDGLCLDVDVPVGATATVHLPGADPVDAGPGHHRFRGAWPDPVTVPPTPTPPFRAPVLAPSSTDVSGGEDWLPASVAAGALRPTVDVASVDVLDDGTVCMPVHHAQLAGPVARLTGRTDVAPDTPHLLRIDFAEPRDLTTARFAYALIDLCLPEPPGRRPELLLRLHGTDGAAIETSARTWPAGWNRIALDIADWSPRSAVTAVEAGVRFVADGSGHDSVVYRTDAATVPVSLHLGELGWSSARRTW